MRQDAEWVIEIQGLLGVINIMGHEHLMVLIGREEVCRLPTPQWSAIYELQDVELIPFNEQRGESQKNVQQEMQVRSIREGLKRFMMAGFYFSYTMDLTSNAQRR